MALEAAQMETIRAALAIGIGAYLAMVLYQRILRSEADPSLRYSAENAGGTASILLSGTHVTMLLTGALAVVTWPLVLENTGLAVALVLANVGHYIVEKREARAA